MGGYDNNIKIVIQGSAMLYSIVYIRVTQRFTFALILTLQVACMRSVVTTAPRVTVSAQWSASPLRTTRGAR